MNKNLFKSLAFAAVAVIAGACAKESEQLTGPSSVTFEVSTPEIATKAIGDGMTATKLYYQVFDADGKAIEGLGVQNKDLVSGKTTVSFQLIKDQTYNFIFWAQTAETGYYIIDEAEGLKKITADYTTHKGANDENRDAFFAVEKGLKITGPVGKTIELKRPFAQVNIATKGEIKAGSARREVDFTGAKSVVKIETVPTQFTPLASAQLSEYKTVTFDTADIPAGFLTVDGEMYKYLSLSYVFAPETERNLATVTATLTVEGKDVSLKVPNIPTQRNFRTNIIGDLLTNSAEFNVVVNPEFDEDKEFNLEKVKTVAELKAALSIGGKITVVDDITTTDKPFSIVAENTEIVVNEGVTIAADYGTSNMFKTLSFFYQGGRLSGNGTIVGPITGFNSSAAAIDVESGKEVVIDGNLTVQGGVGTIDDRVDAPIIIRDGKVTINGGHFISDVDANGKGNPCVHLFPNNNAGTYRASLVINGGVFETKSATPKYLINMQDEYRDRCSILIYGGTFKGFDPGNVNEGTITSFLAPDYKSTKVGDSYVVTKENVTPVADQAGLDVVMANLTSEPATINLPAGNFTTYGKDVTKGKTLTFNGSGAENTNFIVGKNLGVSGEGNSDYSLENADVTFNNLTISTGDGLSYNYRGFVRAKSLTFVNCTIKERLSYWGGVVKFINCKFEPNTYKKEDGSILPDYNITTYQGTEFSFENCSFKSAGKFMNLYKEQNVPYVVRVKDCTFIATKIDKPVLNMKSYTDVEYKIYFEGTNIAKTEAGVEFPLYGGETASNAEVYVNNTRVWSKGQAF